MDMLKSGENNNRAANPPGYLLSDIKRGFLSSLLTGDLNEIVRDAIFTR